MRQHIRAVLDWAAAISHRSWDNRVASVGKGLPRQSDKDEHPAAMPFEKVPAFVEGLSELEVGDSARLVLEFLILTAGRTGEVLGAKWSEIDADEAV